VREKYCWLAGGWWLVLNWCERKALLAGWEPASRTRPKTGIGQRFSHESLVTPTVLRNYTKILSVTLVQIQYKLIVTKIEVWERRFHWNPSSLHAFYLGKKRKGKKNRAKNRIDFHPSLIIYSKTE
jgi:hypothetical protein